MCLRSWTSESINRFSLHLLYNLLEVRKSVFHLWNSDSTQEERTRLHEYFKSQLNVPVISELEDSLYTGIYLYGTDNHLSTEGAQIRTEKVIRDLKEQFVKEEKK